MFGIESASRYYQGLIDTTLKNDEPACEKKNNRKPAIKNNIYSFLFFIDLFFYF